ncbi:uncharacterized protein V6R79_014439 [Siganus canaliculatus]
MPLFKEDPTHLSKSRLKSDLVAHNVALPPAKSKKDVYVELHLKHIDQRNAADFSSDEEDEQVNDVADNEVDPNDAEVPDLRTWTDDDLKDALLQHGIKAGPIVATTRALYEKKLRKVLESNGHENLNGGEKDSVVYSDSEEEEEGPEEIQEETGEQVDQDQEESSHDGGFVYPQCFLLSPKLRACTSRNRGPRTKWNSGNALKSSKQNLPHCAQIPVRISRASPIDQRSGLGSGISAQTQSTKPNGYSSFPSKGFSITKMMESRQSLSSCTDSERELNGSDVKEHWSQSSRLDIPVVDKHIKQNQSVYHKVLSSKWGLQAHLPAGFYFSVHYLEKHSNLVPFLYFSVFSRTISRRSQGSINNSFAFCQHASGLGTSPHLYLSLSPELSGLYLCFLFSTLLVIPPFCSSFLQSL